MKITRLIKKIPKVKRFVSFHNPSLADLITSLGLLNQKNPLVIDIGANTGQSINLMLSINPDVKVYSFEPTPKLVSILKEKYQKNENVQIIGIGLLDKKGEFDFHTSEYSPTNSFLEPNTTLYSDYDTALSNTLSNSKQIKIEVDTFDEWYIKNGNSRIIDLMKIDTQGTEYEVLKGSLSNIQTKIKAISLEFQYLPFYKNCTPFYETMKLLYENGFVLFSFFESSKKNNLQLIENNALFINNGLVKL